MMQDATLTTTARISAELNDKHHDVALTETARLALLAREGLRQVAAGETKAMNGWLVYGAALNEGRELFAKGGQGDKDFGAWIVGHQLDGPNDMERLAAMWTATNSDDFEATRKANPRVRTVRGLHAKWKEDQKGGKPEPVQRRAATIDDLRRVERLRALRDNPVASPGEKANAQSKLDAIEKEVGPVEDAKFKPTTQQGRTEVWKETHLKACHIMDKLSPIMTPIVRTGVINALMTAYKDTPEKLDKILAALNT